MKISNYILAVSIIVLMSSCKKEINTSKDGVHLDEEDQKAIAKLVVDQLAKGQSKNK